MAADADQIVACSAEPQMRADKLVESASGVGAGPVMADMSMSSAVVRACAPAMRLGR